MEALSLQRIPIGKRRGYASRRLLLLLSPLLSATLQGCAGGSDDAHVSTVLTDPASPVFSYEAWTQPLLSGSCGSPSKPLSITKSGQESIISCSAKDSQKVFSFPAGVFEIEKQFLVPPETAIEGANNPNDMSNPTVSPDWASQTLFLATWGVTDYNMNYCHASDMVTTRVGFVLSSKVTIRNIAYQGVDTIRPSDNGALCGGGIFETKGCAENDCSVSAVNNGGSDGIGSADVLIENVRLNDYLFKEDSSKVGAAVPGNYECKTEKWSEECCFCKPNGIRSSQVAVWVPASRNPEGSRNIVVRNLVASSTQADGINFHGKVTDSSVENAYIQNTGDDIYALWGGTLDPQNILFKDCKGVNPGILRPNWYGNCVATYGLKSVTFQNLQCEVPTLKHPIPSPSDGAITIDTSMFVFYNSFGAGYPEGNSIYINGWTFTDLLGTPYSVGAGVMDKPVVGEHKMVWTTAKNGVIAPFYISGTAQEVNVAASPVTVIPH